VAQTVLMDSVVEAEAAETHDFLQAAVVLVL
jgi:hypothetical protein